MIVGVRKGIRPHTPWDDSIEIVNDVRAKGGDILVTVGAGSLTDGAKIITFVCRHYFPTQENENHRTDLYDPARPSPTMSQPSASFPN